MLYVSRITVCIGPHAIVVLAVCALKMKFRYYLCAVATLRLRRLQERRSGDGSGEWLEWLGSQQVALSLVSHWLMTK